MNDLNLLDFKSKEDLRSFAIDIQKYISENSLSYSELIEIQNKLYISAKKFGLVRELKNEGLI